MSFYHLVRIILMPVMKGLFRFKTPRIRFKAPAIVVANHTSILDPVPLGVAIEVPLDFMAKSEAFKVPVLGPFLRACGVFPVVRGGGGRHAIETAISRAKSGRTIAMFPEGTRSKNGQLQPAKFGAAVIAIEAGVPIVPVAIKGTYEVLPHGRVFPKLFRKVTVRAGEPIDVQPYVEMPDGAKHLTERYMATIRELLAED